MILQELTGIKSISDDTITAFLNKLIRDGKVRVRSGSFAFVVIPADTDYVYKVWTHDPGWWEYLMYLNDHPGNEHLLRMKGRMKKIKFTFKRPADFDADLYVAKVEKLDQLTNDLDAHGQISGLTKFFRKVDVDKLTTADIPKINEFVMEDQAVPALPEKFIATAIDVVQNRGIAKNDFHTENVMLRGKTLVITDPYYVSENSKNIHITAADLVQGVFYGKHSMSDTKSGR